jgi:hypothetical protein
VGSIAFDAATFVVGDGLFRGAADYMEFRGILNSAGSTADSSVTTLYHYGDLSGGIDAGRSLSTSPLSELSQYHSGGTLYQFDVPSSLIDDLRGTGLVRDFTDMHGPTGTIVPEVRFLPPASGLLDQYLLPK